MLIDHIYSMDESDTLESDYLGYYSDWLKKEEAWGPNPGMHEHLEYGRRKKEWKETELEKAE